MRVFIPCNSSSSSLSLPLSPPTTAHHRPQKPLLIPPKRPSLISSLTGAALSFNLLLFSPLSPLPPPSIASDFTPSVFQSECREEDQRREEERRLERAPELVTNEEIVKEAWEIVNDSFLGSDRNRWSPQSWLQKKEDVMGTSLQTRSKAHDVIRRMLSSLGDPYTRFLSPAEVFDSHKPYLLYLDGITFEYLLSLLQYVTHKTFSRVVSDFWDCLASSGVKVEPYSTLKATWMQLVKLCSLAHATWSMRSRISHN